MLYALDVRRYMAPEVFRHEPYNLKVDVYSFAMIVFQVRAAKHTLTC